jgi:hypothetical protein
MPLKAFPMRNGRQIKLGRRRPIARCPRLALRNYLRQSLPTPPAAVDFTKAASSALANVYENDELGDCVIAGGYHVVGTLTGNAGDLFTASNAQITADYSAIGGYVPGDPSTDNGCDEQTALNYWTQTGFQDGTKLLGWMAVDATNISEIQTALWLFENIYYGMELPDAWLGAHMPQTSGFVWDVAGRPDPSNGHCVCGVGYNAQGVTIDTWGLLGTLTYAATAKYAVASAHGELYVMLSPDQLARGREIAPSGVAWSDLIADFEAMGGSVASPTPAPAKGVNTAPDRRRSVAVGAH